ncbi:MAG: hypothetical protein RBR74_13890, partial [Ignavibacteriaceae bacterium]|nr:hypothetical protein [Ignavibacteriaceae bacterium]
MYLSYSGQLEQTYQYKLDKLKFRKNFDAVIDLISDLGKPNEKPLNHFNAKQIFVWKGVDNFNAINTYILKYNIGEEVIDTNKVVDYILAQTKKGNLTNWTVA